MRILIADADPQFASTARAALRSESLVIEVVADAASAIERAKEIPYSVVLLDLALPGSRGVEMLARLRKCRVDSPILALTSDAEPKARIEALRFGADDCLVKPVLMAELVARVHALARRAGRKTGDVLEVEDLVLHCTKRRAFRAGQALPLTDREFAALERLVGAHGEPVSSADLLTALWRGKSPPKDNFIAVLMMRVRKKVDDGHRTKLVRTVRGKGYAVTTSDA
jgi:two-component system copper resistance phosphate regulon response regulator CusR